jgi:CRISPR/Cas system CSM-associated protein Csm4 (group 5 of RAMP superfamily)
MEDWDWVTIGYPLMDGLQRLYAKINHVQITQLAGLDTTISVEELKKFVQSDAFLKYLDQCRLEQTKLNAEALQREQQAQLRKEKERDTEAGEQMRIRTIGREFRLLELTNLTVEKLKEKCGEYEITRSGTKSKLLKRILDYEFSDQ